MKRYFLAAVLASSAESTATSAFSEPRKDIAPADRPFGRVRKNDALAWPFATYPSSDHA
jgi:hypothetical protein